MADKTVIRKRLTFYEDAYEKLQEAYLALMEGGVKSYTIGNRSITKFDAPNLLKEMEEIEQRIDELTAQMDGKRPRKAFGVIPRDW